MKLGGTMLTHNCIAFDFCYEESLQNLLELCDEVIVLDGQSNDGTWERLQQLAAKHSKLSLMQGHWVTERGIGGNWMDELCNKARKALTTPMHIFMCADEALHPDSYPIIREHANKRHLLKVHFLNFWAGDPHLFIPNTWVPPVASSMPLPLRYGAAKCFHLFDSLGPATMAGLLTGAAINLYLQ
jgi:glycosyltransferase involved in cell wall biosynthesis